MATNDFTSVYATKFGGLEKNLPHFTSAMAICGKEAHNALKASPSKTYQYDRVEEGYDSVNVYGSDNNIQTFTLGKDALVVNENKFEYSFTQNDMDTKIYHNADAFLSQKAKDAEKLLKRRIEGKFYSRVLDGNVTIDNAYFGGSAGTGIDLSSIAPKTALSRAKSVIAAQYGSYENICAVITPDMFDSIESSATGLGFKYADKTLMNGFKGGMLGIDFYVSTYLTHKITYTFTGQPADAETFNLVGVTGFTLVANGGSLTGEKQIIKGASLATTLDAMESAINGFDTTTATYQATTNKSELSKLRGISATSTDTTLTITYNYGKIVSNIGDLTNATAGTQLQYNYIGAKGAIELANPFGIKNETRYPGGKTDINYLTETFFGTATPTKRRAEFAPLVTEVVW